MKKNYFSEGKYENNIKYYFVTASQRHKWQFLARNNKWSDFDMNTGIKLDALNTNESMNYCFGKFEYTVVKLSDFKGVQFNNSTGAKRQLRRTDCMINGHMYFQYAYYNQFQMEIISPAIDDKFHQYSLRLLCVGYWRSNGYSSVKVIWMHNTHQTSSVMISYLN